MNCFRFIDAERANYSVALLCRVLKVSRSGYYAWRERPPSRRSVGNAALTEKIREVHERSRRTYGYPRVHAELKALGVECGRRRVARLMREGGIQGCMRGKRRSTTKRDESVPPAPDLVDRHFLAASPDRLWLADITCLPTREGFLYLAFILDACSRRVVGWAMAAHLRAELVVDALNMALMRRDPVAGLIHHSDRGTQYTALSFGQRLEEAGIFPSMGRVGFGSGQRDGRSLRGQPEGRNGGPDGEPHVRKQGGREDCRLRLHRRLLQHEPHPLLDRQRQPRRLRASHRRGGESSLK